MPFEYKPRPLTEREQALIDMLWDYLPRDPEHTDRVRTGIGTKTKLGLVRSIEWILNKERER